MSSRRVKADRQIGSGPAGGDVRQLPWSSHTPVDGHLWLGRCFHPRVVALVLATGIGIPLAYMVGALDAIRKVLQPVNSHRNRIPWRGSTAGTRLVVRRSILLRRQFVIVVEGKDQPSLSGRWRIDCDNLFSDAWKRNRSSSLGESVMKASPFARILNQASSSHERIASVALRFETQPSLIQPACAAGCPEPDHGSKYLQAPYSAIQTFKVVASGDLMLQAATPSNTCFSETLSVHRYQWRQCLCLCIYF
jgi:hypothetical protein